MSPAIPARLWKCCIILSARFDQWAEDMELATQKELEDSKRQARDLQRRSRQAHQMAEHA